MGPTYDITGMSDKVRESILIALHICQARHGRTTTSHAKRFFVAEEAITYNTALKINEYQTIRLALSEVGDGVGLYHLDALIDKNKTLGVFRELGD